MKKWSRELPLVRGKPCVPDQKVDVFALSELIYGVFHLLHLACNQYEDQTDSFRVLGRDRSTGLNVWRLGSVLVE